MPRFNKGDHLQVWHMSKGLFLAEATRDFDTEEKFYPLKLESASVLGKWKAGDIIPCRGEFVTQIGRVV